MKTRVANLFKEYFDNPETLWPGLQEKVVILCEQVQAETWKEAAEQVSDCKRHYDDLKGDPK